MQMKCILSTPEIHFSPHSLTSAKQHRSQAMLELYGDVALHLFSLFNSAAHAPSLVSLHFRPPAWLLLLVLGATPQFYMYSSF